MGEIQRTLLKTSLVLQFNMGVVNGKQVVKRKTFSRIKDSATDESLYIVATKLETLQERDLDAVLRSDSNLLGESS